MERIKITLENNTRRTADEILCSSHSSFVSNYVTQFKELNRKWTSFFAKTMQQPKHTEDNKIYSRNISLLTCITFDRWRKIKDSYEIELLQFSALSRLSNHSL